MTTVLSTINLGEFVVRGAEGSVDFEATLSKFNDALRNYVAAVDTEDEALAAAVKALFDKNKGASINMDAVKSNVLHMLGVGVAEHKLMGEKVADFVRRNSGEHRVLGKTYRIGKGKGGGVSRWSDRKEDKAAEKKAYDEWVIDQKAKAEAKAAKEAAEAAAAAEQEGSESGESERQAS